MTRNSPALIPRDLLFGNPDCGSVSISPDGSQLMWLAPSEGALNVWVAPRDNIAAARAVTQARKRGIRLCRWTYNRKYILFLQDGDGDENWHLYALELATGKVSDLTPFENISAQFNAARPNHPDEIVVGINRRNPQWHDIYRINIVTGQSKLLLENERFVEVYVDSDLQLRFASKMAEEGGWHYFQYLDGAWNLWQEVPAGDEASTAIIGFTKNNKSLYLRDSRDRDTSALVEIDLASNQKRILAIDPQADLAEVIRHPTEKHVQAVSFVYTHKRWQILDESIAADFRYLSGLSPGELHITSRSQDDQFWVVVYTVDDGPASFYLYNRREFSANLLFSMKKALETVPLVKMQSVVIKARDGLELVAYYSLPLGSDSKGNGIPDSPLALVFTPHGGPWLRDFWGFHPWHQWLANRGYAVLSLNFRGSRGFGKDFLNAGKCEWGGKIIEDQQDAIRWAIDTGIANPNRVAILGGSFGGYSVLAGLAFSPELFACGVDLVGVANLKTWIESIPPYWKPIIKFITSRVGDPGTEEGRALLHKHSPINYADRICKPLFVAQGANDPRVRSAESEQIVAAMQANAVPVVYAYYPDEGHGFERPENNKSFNAMVEVFLAEHIGGRYEPIGNDLEGSSVEIRAGIELIPGLQQASMANSAHPVED